MHTKYEVSMSNPLAGEVCTDADGNDANANDDANDGQYMIVQGSLVGKPNEPKGVTNNYFLHCKISYL